MSRKVVSSKIGRWNFHPQSDHPRIVVCALGSFAGLPQISRPFWYSRHDICCWEGRGNNPGDGVEVLARSFGQAVSQARTSFGASTMIRLLLERAFGTQGLTRVSFRELQLLLVVPHHESQSDAKLPPNRKHRQFIRFLSRNREENIIEA